MSDLDVAKLSGRDGCFLAGFEALARRLAVKQTEPRQVSRHLHQSEDLGKWLHQTYIDSLRSSC